MSDVERVGIFAKTWERAEKELIATFLNGFQKDTIYFNKGQFATDKIEFRAYEWSDNVRSKRLDTIYYDEDLTVKEFNLAKHFLKPGSTNLYPMTK